MSPDKMLSVYETSPIVCALCDNISVVTRNSATPPSNP